MENLNSGEVEVLHYLGTPSWNSFYSSLVTEAVHDFIDRSYGQYDKSDIFNVILIRNEICLNRNYIVYIFRVNWIGKSL